MKNTRDKKSSGISSYDLLNKHGAEALTLRLAMIWLTVAAAFSVLTMRNAAIGIIPSFATLLPFTVYTVIVIAQSLIFRKEIIHTDVRIFEITTFITGLGIAMQYRMGTFAENNAVGFKLALPVAFAVMLMTYVIFTRGRWNILGKAGYVAYITAILLLAVMVVFGKKYRGGIYLPGNINPSEFIKPLLVIFSASYLSQRKKDFSSATLGIPNLSIKSALPLVILWGIPMVLIIFLHDLGLLLLLNATLIIMLYAVGRRLGYIIMGAIGAALTGCLLFITSGHVQTRVTAWLNPFSDQTGGGWQTLQSLSAIYAGGIWGSGLGAGEPGKVPIVTSDFIYSAVAEELGVIVSGLILALYLSVYLRGYKIAAETKDPFGKLLAIGLTSSLAVQTLLNIAGVTKALPLTGIVLPFLSQGGSGLIAMLAMIGLIAAIPAQKRKNN